MNREDILRRYVKLCKIKDKNTMGVMIDMINNGQQGGTVSDICRVANDDIVTVKEATDMYGSNHKIILLDIHDKYHQMKIGGAAVVTTAPITSVTPVTPVAATTVPSVTTPVAIIAATTSEAVVPTTATEITKAVDKFIAASPEGLPPVSTVTTPTVVPATQKKKKKKKPVVVYEDDDDDSIDDEIARLKKEAEVERLKQELDVLKKGREQLVKVADKVEEVEKTGKVSPETIGLFKKYGTAALAFGLDLVQAAADDEKSRGIQHDSTTNALLSAARTTSSKLKSTPAG